MQQMKSSVHPGDEVAENLSSVSEKDFSEEAVVVDDKNELNDIEEEVNLCDTCGVQGYKNMLVICHNCGVGAEHTYCMAVKLEDVPEKWSCYDCVADTGSVDLDLNVDNNLDLSLDCGSFYRSSSTSNFQAHTRMRASPNPLFGHGSLEEEENQWAKRRRVDTRLSL